MLHFACNLSICQSFSVLAMIYFISTSCASTNSTFQENKNIWQDFKIKFNKTFKSPEDEQTRFKIFLDNLETTKNHNTANFTFKLGINELSDTTFAEYLKMHELVDTDSENQTIDLEEIPYVENFFNKSQNFAFPKSFDWRDRRAVTKVENQKLCGSCYAIAGVSAIESHFFLRTGRFRDFSKQEIIDCGRDYNLYGCNGGLSFRVFDYVRDKGELSLAADYPYTANETDCRKENLAKIPIAVKNYVEIPSNDQEALMEALVTVGPIQISLDISHESFMRYESGIFQDANCTDSTNHSALLVGYGSENGIDYWIVKNSFGEKWGESGYIRIIRVAELSCGIETLSFYPNIE